MGKKGGSSDNSATKAAAASNQELTELAKSYYGETAPIRGGIFDELGWLFGGQPQGPPSGRWNWVASPGGHGRQPVRQPQPYWDEARQEFVTPQAPIGPTGPPAGEWQWLADEAQPTEQAPTSILDRVAALPGFGVGKDMLESQYGRAKENILASMPAGGAMGTALTELEGGRADSLAGLASQLYEDRFSKAYGIATGSPQQAFSGMGAGASGLGQLGAAQLGATAQQRASDMGLLGELGMAAGTAYGGGKGGGGGGKKG